MSRGKGILRLCLFSEKPVFKKPQDFLRLLSALFQKIQPEKSGSALRQISQKSMKGEWNGIIDDVHTETAVGHNRKLRLIPVDQPSRASAFAPFSGRTSFGHSPAVFRMQFAVTIMGILP